MPLDFVELCVCVWHLKSPAEDAGSPGVIDLCEPPVVGVGNSTQVLWKSSRHVLTQTHRSGPSIPFQRCWTVWFGHLQARASGPETDGNCRGGSARLTHPVDETHICSPDPEAPRRGIRL